MQDLKFKFRNEDLLLHYCARTNIDLLCQLKIKNILSPHLDWAYFLESAQKELLCPLLYKAFLKIEGAKGIVPSDIWQRLKDTYYFTLSGNILHLGQLEEIIAHFQKENIKTIIFKGIMLAQMVYADMGLRSSGDIDILVRRDDLFKVDKVLRGLNYYTASGVRSPGEVHFNNYRNSFFYLHQDEKKIPVHIYWHIINLLPYNKNISSGIDMDKIWAEAEPIKLGDASLCTFSKYYQIIYLSMHAFSHSFYPLTLLSDINEFLRAEAEGLDWDKLVEEAYKSGLYKQVYYTLYLSKQILEAALPEDTLAKLKPKKISLFERRFIQSVLEGRPAVAEDWLVYLGMNETLIDRLSFLFLALFPSRAELALIRQKELSRINTLDYIRRFNSGLNRVIQAII